MLSILYILYKNKTLGKDGYTHTHTHTREVDYVKMKAEIKMIFPQDKVSQTASKALEAGGGA